MVVDLNVLENQVSNSKSIELKRNRLSGAKSNRDDLKSSEKKEN